MSQIIDLELDFEGNLLNPGEPSQLFMDPDLRRMSEHAFAFKQAYPNFLGNYDPFCECPGCCRERWTYHLEMPRFK